MRTRLPLLAATLLIVLTACGGNQAKVAGEAKGGAKMAQANRSPKPDQQEPKQGQQPLAQDSTPGSKPNQKTGAKSSTGQRSPSPAPSIKKTLPLERELTPTCGSHGTLMTLKISTRKTASLSIAVAYSDADPHGNYFVGNADDQGKFTYTWVIPPEAPMGKAMVLLGAADQTRVNEYEASSTGESYTEFIPFRVAARC